MTESELPSSPTSKSMTSPIRTFMTPRNPWSFFLNFFWSNIWIARMLSSLTLLRVQLVKDQSQWHTTKVNKSRTSQTSHSSMDSMSSWSLWSYESARHQSWPPQRDPETLQIINTSAWRYDEWNVGVNSRNTSRLYNPSAAITKQQVSLMMTTDVRRCHLLLVTLRFGWLRRISC